MNNVMTFPKLIALIASLLFGLIAVAALFKGDKDQPVPAGQPAVVEIPLNKEKQVAATPPVPPKPVKPVAKPSAPKPVVKSNAVATIAPPTPLPQAAATKKSDDFPEENRIEELFSTRGTKLPIVETVTYSSRADWQKGRPAWLSDYARHYQTSRHFIARSLNGSNDYFKQEVREGDRFNVLRNDKHIQFYLVVDLSRSKMLFYYDDLDAKQRTLLKTYPVGIGRVDSSKESGYLTPKGIYTAGNKIAIYKPKMIGFYNGEQVEMITIFGTRWIPFEKEVRGCTAPAKGLGIHGVPWHPNSNGELVQDASSLGKYESDGCIRLATDDMEELFAIVITKPTVIEIVRDFSEARYPVGSKEE